MEQTALIEHHAALRLACFCLLLLLLAGLEYRFPRVPDTRRGRWLVNAALLLIGILILRLAPALTPVAVALQVNAAQFGLLPGLPLPAMLHALLVIVLLDCLIYWQHVLLHKAPLLWRAHQVHHADLQVDVSTGLRFHPLETVLSAGLKSLAVLLLGADALAVVCYEILLNAAAMFTHSNVRLPAGLERGLRRILVTPDMHRIHHSLLVAESNSNYGNLLSCWDRWFGTYTPAPQRRYASMPVGLSYAREQREQKMLAQLGLPFSTQPREPGRFAGEDTPA